MREEHHAMKESLENHVKDLTRERDEAQRGLVNLKVRIRNNESNMNALIKQRDEARDNIETLQRDIEHLRKQRDQAYGLLNRISPSTENVELFRDATKELYDWRR